MQTKNLFSIVLALIVFAALGSGFILIRSDDSTGGQQRSGQAARIQADVPSVQPAGRVTSATTADEAATPSPAQWIAATNSADPRTRAAAILALATAPKYDALPTLRRLVESGEPIVDRPLALQSLRDLALNQGDADGVIRGVVREAIYHGDDDAIIERAQLALEMIEESETL